jgi:hypothetical protein
MTDPMDSEFFGVAPPQMQQRGPRPLLRFEQEEVHLAGQSEAEGRPVYKMVDVVYIVNPGSRDEAKLIAEQTAAKDEYVAWAYRKWKATQEQPLDGTPISTVPWLNKAQVLELKGINILTLEALAELPDTAKQRMMGLSDLVKKAKAYMAAAKDSAVVTKMASELEQRDAKIAMMEKQMAEMSARFDEMARRVGA